MENYMKDHRSFRDIMKEELTRTRDYLFSLPEQIGQDPGAELGPRQVPGPVISKDGKAPRDLEIRLLNKPPSIDPGAGSGSGSVNVDPDTGYPVDSEEPEDQGSIPLNALPLWLGQYLDSMGFPNGLPEGYEIHAVLSMNTTMYAIVGPDGEVINLLVHYNGETTAFPPSARVVSYDNGVPLVYVPGGSEGIPGYPGPALYHAGGAYIEFLPGAFPGVNYPVWRGANGEWYYQDSNGNRVTWSPDDPGGTNQPPEGTDDEGLAGWWSGLSDWMKGILIAAAIAGAVWLGAEIVDWIQGNGHQGQEGGGPPAPPGGDDSDDGEGGGGDPPVGGGGDPPGNGGGGDIPGDGGGDPPGGP